MKREIMPDGWLGAWIKAKWQSKRAKRAIGHMGFSTAEMAKLNERLQQLKAKYSKA